MKIVALSLFIGVTCAYQHTTTVGRLHEIADQVNQAKTTWTAHKLESNSIKFDRDREVNYYMGGLESQPPAHAVDGQSERANFCEDNGLPKNFDSRKNWPECKRVIGHVFDQAKCGSCWAVAVTTAFNDRVCIKSKGKIQDYFSVNQMLTCCKRCFADGHDGCQGGWPLAAWSYINKTGLVTGGDYDSNEGCQPYRFPRCDYKTQDCKSLSIYKATECKLHCYNEKYEGSFNKDIIKAEKYYTVAPCAAMNEIFKNGPIAAYFTTYEDFHTYKSGIYQYITGRKVGHHVVRVIGWGEEKGTPYWLVANSWNHYWGENGFFKIKRGTNEVWFESSFSAGIPKL